MQCTALQNQYEHASNETSRRGLTSIVFVWCTAIWTWAFEKPLYKSFFLPFVILNQGWLKIWIWQLWPKFVTFIPLWILGNDTNIICLPTKNMQFCKIKRLWLKNWACHAHLKFKIQKGVASSFFEPHPPNFGKICILYRWKNDIITIFK